jgi:DNA-binding transcriptional regulator YhcF (GntR family)
MNIQLQDASHGPVYLQVREQIEAQIKGGQLVSGASLPAPATLAQQIGVDKGEVQRAYFELEQYKLVSKKAGKDFLGKEKVAYTVR